MCQPRRISSFCTAPAGVEADFVAHRVIPVLNSLGQIDAWTALARSLGRKLPAVLQVDTGMSRLGLSKRELDTVAADPAPAGRHRPPLRDEPSGLRRAAEPRVEPRAACQLPGGAGDGCRRRPPASPTRPACSWGLTTISTSPGRVRPFTAWPRSRASPTRSAPSSGFRRGSSRCGRSRRGARSATAADGRAAGRAGSRRFPPAMPTASCAASATAPRRIAGDRPAARRGGFHGHDHARRDRPARRGLSRRPGRSDRRHNPVDAVAEAAGTIGYEILTSLGGRYFRTYLGGCSSSLSKGSLVKVLVLGSGVIGVTSPGFWPRRATR